MTGQPGGVAAPGDSRGKRSPREDSNLHGRQSKLAPQRRVDADQTAVILEQSHRHRLILEDDSKEEEIEHDDTILVDAQELLVLLMQPRDKTMFTKSVSYKNGGSTQDLEGSKMKKTTRISFTNEALQRDSTP
ncbi:unnamed protein product [Linum trigynum]|uniref:Uncharacterized protein n=1 Tax=Linum trigynum TaxID=586398 RepID=A0AAV2ETG5_9ROSI